MIIKNKTQTNQPFSMKHSPGSFTKNPKPSQMEAVEAVMLYNITQGTNPSQSPAPKAVLCSTAIQTGLICCAVLLYSKLHGAGAYFKRHFALFFPLKALK